MFMATWHMPIGNPYPEWYALLADQLVLLYLIYMTYRNDGLLVHVDIIELWNCLHVL